MAKTIGDFFSTGFAIPRVKPGQIDVSPALKGLRTGRLGPGKQQKTRKAQGRKSIQAFCDTYLSHHFNKGYGEHHTDMFAAIDAPSPPAGKRVARIEPRMFGKTTVISLAVPLYCLAYQTKKFILLVGESGGNASANLQTLVHELENNELLLQDFPHLVPARDAKNQPVKWADSEIQLASGAVVVAKGMASRMRGMKRQQHRPDLGIVDDPESPETAGSFTTRMKNRRWFGGTFLGLGNREDWDVYVIGNLPHHDCLVAHLVRDPGWDGKLYRAINIPRREDEKYPVGNTRTDGTALWPDVWPLEKLDAYKADPTVGALGFAREMMNDPRDEKDRPFDINTFEYFDFFHTPEFMTRYVSVATYIDPAGGEKPNEMKKGRKDWACVVTGGRTKDGFIDVFDIVMTRKMPEQQMQRLLDVYDVYRPRLIGAEENIAKNLIGPTINKLARERNLYPHIIEIQQIRNKVQRILSLEPLITNKTVRFARHLKDKWPDYFGQWDDFPGDHDDGPDATEGMVRMLEKSMAVGIPSGVEGTSYWRKGA
jgi:predicted phage terminase large subunit-like protein